MRTRSKVLSVEIDFDEASAAWKANKVSQGNGPSAYRCCSILRNGEPCSQKSITNSEFCKKHNKQTK